MSKKRRHTRRPSGRPRSEAGAAAGAGGSVLQEIGGTPEFMRFIEQFVDMCDVEGCDGTCGRWHPMSDLT